MEARSLGSLNLLASNPPQYPTNPSEEPQEPITLYISRVPGTRDVILSPFKPQIKNVTVEDVASSLYYIHLELSSGSGLPNPQPLRDDELRSSSDDSSSAKAIPRKPLPQNVRKPLPPNARPITPEEPPPEEPPPLSTITTAPRLQVPQDAQAARRQNRLSATSYGSYDGPPPPMPPRPTQDDSGVGLPDYHPLPAEPFAEYSPDAYAERSAPPRLKGPRPMSSPHPSLLDRPLPAPPEDFGHPDSGRAANRRSWVTGMGGMGMAGDRSSRSPSPRHYGGTSSPGAAPFTLTLIRRDPSTGNQWNVGRISSHEVQSSAGPDDAHLQAPSQSALATNPPIDIALENSGYAKFRNMPVKRSLDLSSANALSELAGRSAEDVSQPPRGGDGPTFTRQAIMSYSKSWASTMLDKIAPKGHGRHESRASASSGGSEAHADLQGMKARGYVFASPWDGRCEFRTGNAGRSVRCLHALPGAAAYNPLVAGDHEEDGPPRAASAVVSELRFNLPGSDMFAPEEDRPSQWRGHFSRLMGGGGGGGGEDDDAVSPFDVNVGAERAGGGNRGKRAKLGKLIIYNDGQKMLDLLVAANVGVWWGAWERNF